MTAAVAIICKTPRVGASKTRMIPIVGAETAAALAGAFLSDMGQMIKAASAACGCAGFAAYAPAGSEAELAAFLPSDFGLLCRQDATFGIVLEETTRTLLGSGHVSAILVNADSPTLPADYLVRAVEALAAPGDRVVLGPAIDGGYYLIGLKTAHSALFDNIPWSTDAVFARTLERAAEINLEVVELSPWYDVDDASSLRLLAAELGGEAPPFADPSIACAPAQATRALMATRKEFAR